MFARPDRNGGRAVRRKAIWQFGRKEETRQENKGRKRE